MSVHKDNRNMVLLAAATAVSVVIAGIIALFGPAAAKQESASPAAYRADPTPVRVIGAPFVPNVDPHRR